MLIPDQNILIKSEVCLRQGKSNIPCGTGVSRCMTLLYIGHSAIISEVVRTFEQRNGNIIPIVQNDRLYALIRH